MSNLSREVIADTLYDLTVEQSRTLETCIKSLTTLKESGKVSETNLRSLINVWRELDALRELYYLRLFNSLKRGNMVSE